MRRRRHKLEVSTFPFLAVLLCAMGSLILMLLVLDRRAKAAARERAQRATEQVAAEELRIAEQRRQEWEKRRQALHAEMLGQERELSGQIAAVERQITAARAKATDAENRHKDQHECLRQEQERLSHLEEEIRGRRGAAARSDEKAQDSGQELRRLSSELRSLERTLDELKALRQRQQQTYSVVPYRGRRGDNRAPLYLECAASGLIFHPDRKTIGSPRTASDEIKAEVERRIGQQRVTLTAAGRTPDPTPYLLMLVRPDGISTYYQVLKSLHGLDRDFGYELIDAEWVLEFPSEDQSAKPQPWMVVERPTTAIPGPSASASSPRQAPAGIKPGGTGSGWTAQSGNGDGSGAKAGTGPIGQGSAGDVGPWHAASGNGNNSSGGQSGQGGGVGPLSQGRGAGGSPMGVPAALGNPQPLGRPAGVMFGGPPGQGGPSGESGPRFGPLGNDDRRADGGRQTGRPIGAGGLPGPLASGLPSGTGDTSAGSPTTAGPASAAIGENEGGTPPGSMNLAAGASSQRPEGPPSRGEEQGGANGRPESPGSVPHSPTPIPTSAAPRLLGAGAKTDNPPGQGSSDSASSSAHVAADGGDQAPGGATGGRRTPLQGLDNELGKPKRPARRPEIRPAILGGDRDYIIMLECRGDAVVLHPFGNSFSAESLAPTNGGGPLLQEAISRLIARRQATARPGEQPYRPQVRFLVRPGGLRSLHRVYPVLEGLHIPLTRQNVDADEEVAPGD